MKVQEQMVALLFAHMNENGITQAELARRTGRSTKHINQVVNGKAGTMELDYWAFVLGVEFTVSLGAASSVKSGDADV